jgi:hypothetical protein
VGSGRPYLEAFARLHTLADVAERRGVTRQGLAMIAQIAEREPAPLEGVAPEDLQRSVRVALDDGNLAELDWLSPAAGAIAMFELAQALPAGAERRELGRRVLTRLRDADRDTFVRLLVAFARSSPKLFSTGGAFNVDALRARTEVVLAAPLTQPGAIGELALGLLAQPLLAASWVEGPAMGALPGRRLAARILAHGAREAVRRHDAGDRGGVAVMRRGSLRVALTRLLRDREALVWRFAGIARGLLAHVDPDLAAEIDRELKPTATSTQLRRASASAAAALERGGAATVWIPTLVERAAREQGVARGAILGLAGYAMISPRSADELATQLIECAPLDGVEALAELRRDEEADLLPHATELARAWVRGQLDTTQLDDGRHALLHALVADLDANAPQEGLAVPLASARIALDSGNITNALRDARVAVDDVVAAADWLARASDDDALDRRHSLRLLRELDRELFADNTLNAVLALAPEADPARVQFAEALAAIEASLLARETRAESGPVEHGGLRVARLRALVRILDGIRASSETDLEPRLAVVRQLMARAADDRSSLRRAVWAALTRAGDALLRDGHAEITDLLLVWTFAFPDEEFAIVREASMVPEIEAAFEAYARLHQATWAAADPDNTDAVRVVVERVGELADALPPEQSPRVESVRLSLARVGNALARVVDAGSHSKVPADAIDAIGIELGALARRVYGAHRRLGVPVSQPGELETTFRAIRDALADTSRLDEAIAVALDAVRVLPPAIASAIERVLLWLGRRPTVGEEHTTTPLEVILPGWVPLSRQLGSYYVVRPLGRGAGGSVLLGVRSEERTRADRELVALKVPEYSGSAARTLSEQEFEELFREEASALLSLPAHPNIARFITFDAAAQPKPILAMEYVRGHNLERALEAGDLDMRRALSIIDDVFAGIEAMHKARIAHLDVKPANVVLRSESGNAVLVDFGLAGRRVRTGCGSPHYAAAEVWDDRTNGIDPFPADVYAAACVAFEVLTNCVLIRAETLQGLIDRHFHEDPGGLVLERVRDPQMSPLVELVRAAVVRDPARRPTATRLRAGFAAIAADLVRRSWPLPVS